MCVDPFGLAAKTSVHQRTARVLQSYLWSNSDIFSKSLTNERILQLNGFLIEADTQTVDHATDT